MRILAWREIVLKVGHINGAGGHGEHRGANVAGQGIVVGRIGTVELRRKHEDQGPDLGGGVRRHFGSAFGDEDLQGKRGFAHRRNKGLGAANDENRGDLELA